jgi:effector-binding domain-containing protein
MKTNTSTFYAMLLLFIALGCKEKKAVKPSTSQKEEKSQKTESKLVVSQKGPIINLQDTIETKKMVLCIKDSSKTRVGMNQKLANIYNSKLPEAIKANKLSIVGDAMAWHTTQKNAFFFEAGIPVNKAPAKMGKGMYIKNTGNDCALIAHFWGPNELNKSAYEALAEMLKDKHKRKTGNGYEIYIGNPFNVTKERLDFYKLQTDIVLPYK